VEETITQQWGAFGAVFLLVLAPLAAFAVHQTRALAAAQQERVTDAKAVAGTVIAVIKDFSEAARDQVRSQTEQRAASENVAEALTRVEARIGHLEVTMGKIVAAGGNERRS
jgi:hypothetical protein